MPLALEVLEAYAELTLPLTMETPNEKAVVFLPWNTIEPEAQQQILNTAKMPFVFKHVAVMPDCHYGKGATVGTVLPTNGAIIPAAVGMTAPSVGSRSEEHTSELQSQSNLVCRLLLEKKKKKGKKKYSHVV